MKLEEIKNKTNEAVSYLVAALESGKSEVLTQYLNAMARFHHYSFGNIMLIARHDSVVRKLIPSVPLHSLNSLTVTICGPLSLRPSSWLRRRTRSRAMASMSPSYVKIPIPTTAAISIAPRLDTGHFVAQG